MTPLYLGLERLEEVQRFKYLGLDFKSNLSWVLLKQRIVAKAKSRIALVSRGIARGLAPDASLKLWRTLIQPILEYGMGVWGVTHWPEAERIQLEMGV